MSSFISSLLIITISVPTSLVFISTEEKKMKIKKNSKPQLKNLYVMNSYEISKCVCWIVHRFVRSLLTGEISGECCAQSQ